MLQLVYLSTWMSFQTKILLSTTSLSYCSTQLRLGLVRLMFLMNLRSSANQEEDGGHVTRSPPIGAHLRSSARLSLVLRFMSSVTWMLLPRSRLAFRSTSSLSLKWLDIVAA